MKVSVRSLNKKTDRTPHTGFLPKTCIIDGRIPHSILIEILSNEGIGTLFK